MKAARFALVASCLGVLTLTAAAADWPQWRGPDRTGVSRETGLLKTWSGEGPKLAWTFKKAGAGYSGPSIVGDTLYCCGSEPGREFVFAVNVKTGEMIWSTDFSKGAVLDRGDGPRGNPTIDGDLVYALGGKGDLICVKAATGEKVWAKELPKDLGGRVMSGWGYSESVLVDGDQVVCTPGGAKGTVAALNKKNGELLWQSKEATDPAGYSSVIVATVDGVKQYIQMTGKGVVGVAPKDGKVLWHYTEGEYKTAVAATPIYHDNHVFISRSYGVGCDLIKLTKTETGNFKAERVYANKNMVNHHGGVILIGNDLYGYSDGKGWVCQDFKTGEIKWADKQLDKGSLTCVDGMLYCYGESSGNVVLVEASPKGWKEAGKLALPEKSTIRKPNGTKFWTHPVVSNGKLFVRDQDLLFCFDVKAK